MVDKIEGRVKVNEEEIGSLSDGLIDTDARMDENAECIQENRCRTVDNSYRIDKMDSDERKKIIVLEGFKETQDENLRGEIGILFKDLGLDYGTEKIESISRRGKYVAESKRPRPVVIFMNSKTVKGDVYKNIRKLAGKQKWTGSVDS